MLKTKPEKTKIEFNPHPGQVALLNSPARFIAAMGGKRGGKTTGGCYWSYREWQKWGPNTEHLIGAPTYDQLNASVLTKLFKELPPLRRFYKKKDKIIELPGGIVIFCRSLDQPQHIEGLNLSSFWIDEADGLNKATWDILQSRTGTTLGRGLLTSTIYPSSWIYEEKRENPDLFDILTWESQENPAFSKGEWERLQRVLPPDQFAREYQSQFIFGQGAILADVLRYGVVAGFPTGETPVRGWIGLDFGFGDPTAIIVLVLTDAGNYYIVDEHYQTQMNIVDIEYHLARLWDKHTRETCRLSYTFVDGQSAIPKHSLSPRFNILNGDKNIDRGISFLRNLVQTKRLFVFGAFCPNTMRELRDWSWEKRGIGSVPEDRNNHTIDALRYAAYTSAPMVMGIDLKVAPEAELNRFWQRKKDEGLLQNGQLVDKLVGGGDEDTYLDSSDDYFDY